MLIHNSLAILLPAALAIGFIHTLMGPDHYIPFIAMAKVKNWPLKKALFITTLCGIGHVGSALLLALIGAALGLTLTKLNLITSTIGSAAAWLLIVFGILYFIWGLKSSSSQSSGGGHGGPPLHEHLTSTVQDQTGIKLYAKYWHRHPHHEPLLANRKHRHPTGQRSSPRGEPLEPGDLHELAEEPWMEIPRFPAGPGDDGAIKKHSANSKEITPWILFTIFILGPCEALIPLVLYPAIRGEIINLFSITIVFGLATLLVMLSMVTAAIFGVKKVNFEFLTKYGNAIAGLVICSTGCAIKILGL